MAKKRFPADTAMENKTFLNDKKINGELYSYLQSLSMPRKKEDGIVETVVYKKDMPVQADICSKIGIKTAKTLRNHINYLIQQGYIIDEKDYYYLPNKEDIYLLIPLETIQFLNDTLKDQVIKIYIYLGQKWNYKKGYEFTIAELAQHIGIKLDGNQRGYDIINNALDCLSLLGLIHYVEFYDKQKPKKRLINFSLEKPSVR